MKYPELKSHWSGKQFVNQEGGQRSLKEFLRWIWTRKPTPWPEWIDLPAQKPSFWRVNEGSYAVTFINHSTTLIQVDGWNILTDPIWSKRCGPLNCFGPKRIKNPGMELKDLPPIDIVLISHDHYDHLDVKTLRYLSAEHRPLVFTGLNGGAFLERLGFPKVIELDWWKGKRVADQIEVTFLPARHFSGRYFWGRNTTLWGSFLIQVGGWKLYFAGDSGYGRHFRQIRALYGNMDLALIPIGVYKKEELMQPVHMNPFEAVQAHIELGSKKSFGIHLGTFHLSDEGVKEPVCELEKAKRHFGIAPLDFDVLQEGKCWLSLS